MKPSVIALFGEAERGDLDTMYYCERLDELFHFFGQPPPETEGLYHAIQALLYGQKLLYFRVREEGMSTRDYLLGLNLLREHSSRIPHINALFLPKVGVQNIIEEGISVCKVHQGLLIMKDADFYDYITDAK